MCQQDLRHLGMGLPRQYKTGNKTEIQVKNLDGKKWDEVRFLKPVSITETH